MKKLLILTVLANFFIHSLGYKSGPSQNADQNTPTDMDCSDALKRFTDSVLVVSSNFLKSYVNATPRENGAVSPIASMFNLIGIALFAKGVSKNESYTTLNLHSREEMTCVANIINNEANSYPDCVKYGAGTDFFANDQDPFTSAFKSNMSDIVDGKAINLNFSDQINAANTINSVVASQTRNEITNIIKDSSIFNCSTEIVSITAMFLTGDWEIEFQKTDKVKKFRLSASESAPQTFMYQNAVYKYGHSDAIEAEVVEINFCCRSFSVWIIKPDKPFMENDVIDKMSQGVEWYYELRDKLMQPTRLDLFLAKHCFDTRLDSKTRFQEATGVYSIYDHDAIDLEGAFEGDVQAAISDCVQNIQHYVGYKGGAVRNGSKSKKTKKTFKTDYPYIMLVFREGRVYIAGVFRQPVSECPNDTST